MDKKEIMERLDQAFIAIQSLDIRPTKGNIETLIYTLNAMKAAYDALGEIVKEQKNGEGEKEA